MDLSEKQETLLEYIKKFQEEKGRSPRLSELTNRFGISNSAILQRLESLQKSGDIYMPDGVLSIITRPKFDVFISYSSEDKIIADEIQNLLQKEGFRVWKDNRLKPGDYFASEIFRAIRNSKVFLLLLSDNAIKSNFVKEELSHAKSHSIYKEYPKIFPVIIKEMILEVFPEISNVQRHKLFDLNDESRIIQLMDDMQMKMFSQSKPEKTLTYNSGFSVFKSRATSDLKKNTNKKEDYDFFEFFLEPLENPEIKSLPQIDNILEKTKVDIQRWGGFDMPPFYQNSENLKAIPTQSGIRFLREASGDGAWFRTWEIYFFNMDKNGNFFYRNSLRESFAREENIVGKFSIDWLVLDVTRSLMFTKNLIDNTACRKWKIELHYHGLEGKELSILNSRRMPLFWSYKKEAEDDYTKQLIVDPNTSLVERAYDICYEILWIFGWKNINENVLRSDISSIVKGIFPQ